MGTSFSIWRQVYTGKSLNSHMINTHIIAYSYLLTHAMSSHIGQLDISLKPALEGERGRGSCFRLPDTSPSVGTWRLQPKTTALLHIHQALVGDMLNHSKMESSLQLIIPAFSLVSKKVCNFFAPTFMYFSGFQTRWILPTCRVWRRPTILWKAQESLHQYRISTCFKTYMERIKFAFMFSYCSFCPTKKTTFEDFVVVEIFILWTDRWEGIFQQFLASPDALEVIVILPEWVSE